MINVSAEFKEQMKTRTDFKQYAEITLTNGAVWAVDESDFTIENNSVSDSAGTDGLPLGAMISRTIQIELMNDDNRFEDVDFMGAEIRLYLTFQLSNSVERVELGYFTVISPETYGKTVIIEAMDNSWKLDTPYITSLAYPQSAGAVFRDICTRCSILAESSDFLNNDFVIESAPDSGLTNREMIGYIAMIAGGNARFNRYGKLEILTYEFPDFRYADKDYDGGTFEGWTAGDVLDGGDFSNWKSGDVADGGAFSPWNTSSNQNDGGILTDDTTHVLRNWINLKPFTEDIVITGIQTTKTVTDSEGNETETPVMYGTDGYVLSIENPLISGKEEAALALIGDVLVGARIRNFEGDHIGYPLAEFMDKAVLVDRKGNAAPTVLTDINFSFFGITTMANSAAPPLRLSSKYNSAAAQAIIAAKNLVAKEKTQRELAIENLNNALSTSSGLYSTSEIQADGSTIYYLHDKPTLTESRNVMKLTAEAIGFSTDGGETYPFGFTLDGDMVARILSAEGVNADWIKTGAFVIENAGDVVFNADSDSKTVVIKGKYFTLDSSGSITATNATITGTINANDGTIGGFTISGARLFTEDHKNPAGDYVPGIVLDTENGVISVGAGQFKSNASGQARIGTASNYILFDDGSSQPAAININGDVYCRYDARFSEGVVFEEMPTFPDYIPVSEGGTGKGSFSNNALLAGNGTGDLKAINTFAGVLQCDYTGGLPYFAPLDTGGGGVIGGQTSVTLSTSAVEKSVSLSGANSYYIVANPNINTGNPINWTVCSRTSTGFKIKCAPNSALNGTSVGFDWIAIPM